MSALDIQVGGDHYKSAKIQPIQYIEANGLGFLEGCVVKRVTRHGKPTGKGRQDIEKAIHELQLLLEMRYPAVEAPRAPAPIPGNVPQLQMPVAPAPSMPIGLSSCLVCGEPGGHFGMSCPKAVPVAHFGTGVKPPPPAPTVRTCRNQNCDRTDLAPDGLCTDCTAPTR